MKIALIGYGKMGKTIERIARERGHEIVSIIDINNPEDFGSEAFNLDHRYQQPRGFRLGGFQKR